jgi:hypothetical protein
MSARVFAYGGNYLVEIENGIARCRVWRRPDVSAAEGASFAEEKIAIAQRLVAEPSTSVRGFVLDLKDAPPVVGPRTEDFLRRMLALWEAERRRVAVVVGDHATQVLQVGRLVRSHAPATGRVTTDLESAVEWASKGRPSAAPR